MQTGTLTRGQTENDDFSKGAVLKVFMCLLEKQCGTCRKTRFGRGLSALPE